VGGESPLVTSKGGGALDDERPTRSRRTWRRQGGRQYDSAMVVGRARLRLVSTAWVVAASFCESGCDEERVEARVVALSALPADLVFATIPVGVVDDGVVVISNGGNAPWVPAGPPQVDGLGFSWVSGCDEPLGPQRTCELRVRFAPAQLGEAQGLVTVVADGVGAGASDASIEVPIRGAGAPAVLSIQPTTLDFGTLPVDDLSVQVVEVVNDGADSLSFELVTIGEGFRAAGSDRARLVLEPFERRQVNVVFQPRRGGPMSASIIGEVCGARCGPQIQVIGNGAAPRIDAEPRRLVFGDVVIGTESEAAVALKNVGVGVLVIEGIELLSSSSDLHIESFDLPLVLDEGTTVMVPIRFAPQTGYAEFESVLVVSSNDALSDEVYVPIVAAAAGPGLEILPSALNFGRLADGEVRETVAVARSIGTVAVTDVHFAVDGPFFELREMPTVTQLLPTEAVVLTVRATASSGAIAAGGGVGSLIVTGAEASATTPLSFLAGHTGCAPVASATHVNLGFALPRVGTSGAISIRNEGDAPCVLNEFTPGGSGLGFDEDFSIAPVGLRVLAPGDTGEVSFAFASARTGSHLTTVELGFVDVSAPMFVSAEATVVDARLGVVPSTVVLGPVARSCPDPTGLASLVNGGGTTVEVTSIELVPSSAPFGVSIGSLPVQLAPGVSHPVSITGLLEQTGTAEHLATVRFETSVGASATLRLAMAVVPDEDAVVEVFTVSAPPAVDVLFIVDNSGSMEDDQAQLAANFASFFEEGLAAGAPTFQVGVTTTDVLTGNAARGHLVGDPSVLTATTARLAEAFAANVRVGIEGTGLELGLEAMRLALLSPENARLFRRDAALSVVFVTDEEDAGAFPEELPDPALASAPSTYISLLQAFKGGTVGNAPILVSGVVTPGFASRYEEVVHYFNGAVLDIQSPVWGTRLADIGTATFSLSRTFRLSDAANAGSITVEVDGVSTTAFVYDDERRVVILRDQPAPGTEVTITYQSGCR
jgi:hypothetical protein